MIYAVHDPYEPCYTEVAKASGFRCECQMCIRDSGCHAHFQTFAFRIGHAVKQALDSGGSKLAFSDLHSGKRRNHHIAHQMCIRDRYCTKLIEAMQRDYAGYSESETPPYIVKKEHIKKVLAEQTLQAVSYTHLGGQKP